MIKKGILKTDISIGVEKCGVRIIFFTFKNKKIDIKDDYFLENRLETRVFLENKSKSDYINKIKNSITCNSIKNNIEKYGRIYINIQEADIMLRNINIDLEIKDEMLKKATEIEVREYIPNVEKDYILKFRDIERNEEFKCVRTVLFPKKYKELYGSLCDEIKCDKKYISINFDILGKLLHESENIKRGNRLYIECRREDLIVSKVKDKRITESYTIRDEDLNVSALNQITADIEEVYIYGNYKPDIIGMFSAVSELKEPYFNFDIVVNLGEKEKSVSEYTNLVGFLI